MDQTRVAVVGAGAVGCYFGGILARAGVPVTLIGRAHHMDAIAANGLVLETLKFHETVQVKTATDLAAAAGAEVVLFCVKTPDTETVAQALVKHLAPQALVVGMQNGVDNAARIFRATKLTVLPTVVYVAAAMAAPGHVKHSGRGDLIFGSDPDPLLVSQLFANAGVPWRVSLSIQEELWIKMVMNCAYNAISALGRARYGVMIAFPPIRELIDLVVEETVLLAHAEGVTLEIGAMLDAAHKLGEAMSGAMSSTAQDLERGKLTEIDSLNGYVVRRGAELGIATPISQSLWSLVKLLEKSVAS